MVRTGPSPRTRLRIRGIVASALAAGALATVAPASWAATATSTAQAGAQASLPGEGQAATQPRSGAAPAYAGQPLYVSPTPSGKALQASPNLNAKATEALTKIASQSQAQWVGTWVTTAKARAHLESLTAGARQSGAVLPLVIYGIPYRDCGGYSAGGAASAEHYRKWIDEIAAGIGDAQVIVILEPDALLMMDCLAPAPRAERLSLLRYAGERLSALPNSAVYLDAGNSGWKTSTEVAARLVAAGVAGVRGFSLNVSNFNSTANEVAYGRRISALTGGKPFVLDTSRNGNGALSASAWCNPPGRALGAKPTTTPGIEGVDALLWVKTIGSSDGSCHPGDLPAGSYDINYALGLAYRASW